MAFDGLIHQVDAEDNRTAVRGIKKTIRATIEKQVMGKQGFNDYHLKIMKLGYDDVLTTNYDYSLQKSVVRDFYSIKNKCAQNRQERKHSLKRCYQLPDVKSKVWHIHGELFDSRNHSSQSKDYPEGSIMIGYEHYASYLEEIQQNVKGKSGKQPVEKQSLFVRLRDGNHGIFWTDILFTHDIDIVGQGLDFSENHLWWLITHRAKILRDGALKEKRAVNNKISFFYPQIANPDAQKKKHDSLQEQMRIENSLLKERAIAELLNAFYVVSQPIECNSYENFYDRFLLQALH